MHQLLTRRLLLERPAQRFGPRLARWQRDEELRHLSDDTPEPPTEDEVAAALERWNRPGRDDLHMFAIHARANDEAIGFLQVANVDRHHRCCDLGLLIGERRAWGRGLGREAVEAALRYAFDELDMHRVSAEVYAHNERSLRLFAAAGFRREGVVRERVVKTFADGVRPVDAVMFGLLQREWRAERTDPFGG